jgi:hypothetical protein
VTLLVSHVLLSLGAWLRTAHWSWFGDVGRPIILAVLAWLVLQGHSWARWALVAWLALAVFSSIGAIFFMGAAGFAFGPLLAAAMAGLYVWIAVELVLADVARAPSRSG